MPPNDIEHYALIGDCTTAALVGRDGSVDWLCWPRFDSAACFAALLGGPEHGRFKLAPADAACSVKRSYRAGSLVLETVFDCEGGQVALIDFMVPEEPCGTLVRIVEARRGVVPMQLDLALRFDYGLSVPWVTRRKGGNGFVAVAGPELVVLRTPVALHGRDLRTVSEFTVREGDRISFVLTHGPSHLPPPISVDAEDALYATEEYWANWSGRCTYDGPWADVVQRSLLTLKCLTYAPTGGIVAAPTTSLPEALGGVRNWDYRFCWLRDATITLFAFMAAGYTEEAGAWAGWLHRSIAGSPEQVQIMYGIAGERRLEETEVPWLPGYQGAAPVRVGNAAATQLQLDVYGEVMDALHQARSAKLLTNPQSWSLQCALLEHLEEIWQQPDEGLWETRGGRKHFTFSKVMAWVAFDRGIKDAEIHGLEAPLDRWRQVRDQMHATVCQEGYDKKLGSFTQSFGDPALDASLLLIPLVGFLPHDDPRVQGTVRVVERELLVDGFVLRYRTESGGDGLPGGEGAFLACSFWLASAWHMQGRRAEAKALFERLLGLCNDVGLLSEEYDPQAKRMTGNFPQAFSHVALITTALTLAGEAQDRKEPMQAAAE
ncbi:MAG: glycoside hydrolase family 15 protein [Janthinobacterium lividum]